MCVDVQWRRFQKIISGGKIFFLNRQKWMITEYEICRASVASDATVVGVNCLTLQSWFVSCLKMWEKSRALYWQQIAAGSYISHFCRKYIAFSDILRAMKKKEECGSGAEVKMSDWTAPSLIFNSLAELMLTLNQTKKPKEPNLNSSPLFRSQFYSSKSAFSNFSAFAANLQSN